MLNRGPNLGGKLRVSQMRHRHQNRHMPKPHSSELPILYEESVSGNPPRTARATPQKTKSAATIPYAALLSARTPRKRNGPLRQTEMRNHRRLPRNRGGRNRAPALRLPHHERQIRLSPPQPRPGPQHPLSPPP